MASCATGTSGLAKCGQCFDNTKVKKFIIMDALAVEKKVKNILKTCILSFLSGFVSLLLLQFNLIS